MKKTKTMSAENVAGLTEGIRQMIDHMQGRIHSGTRVSRRPRPVAPNEVKQLRQSLGLTQGRFALVVGEGVAAVQSWEQGLRQPSGAASKLIRVLATHPELAPELLRAQ